MTFTINAESGVPEVPEGILFYCGSQITSDDDMLPSSFTVFAPSVPIEIAIQLIMANISDDLQELGVKGAEGQMAFLAINTWADFAELKLDDSVKMRAISEAVIASAFAAVVSHGAHLAEVAQGVWAPDPSAA